MVASCRFVVVMVRLVTSLSIASAPGETGLNGGTPPSTARRTGKGTDRIEKLYLCAYRHMGHGASAHTRRATSSHVGHARWSSSAHQCEVDSAPTGPVPHRSVLLL